MSESQTQIAEENSPTQNEQNTSPLLPQKTIQERINSGEPHIKWLTEVIFTKRYPSKDCKHCQGLGYQGIYRTAESALPKMPLGPNDQCPCKSGKKFKKCCQSFVQRMRHSGGQILVCGCVGRSELAINPNAQEAKDRMKLLDNNMREILNK